METLRYGIVGAGFVAQFHLRALESVRGVEVAGLTSRTPPHRARRDRRGRAGSARPRVFDSVREMARNVDVVAIFNPNFAPTWRSWRRSRRGRRRRRAPRPDLREAARAQPRRGAPRRRARERDRRADRVLREPDPHEDAPAGARPARGQSPAAMGPLTLARAARGARRPAQRWFWDPTLQGGGVLSDMGCHSIAVGWYLLTPAGRPLRHLEPRDGFGRRRPAQVGPAALAGRAARRHGVDYAKTPAEDFATGLVTYREPRHRAAHARRSSPSRGCTTSRACACSSTASARATRSRRTACARRSRCSSATPRRRRSPTPSSRSRRRRRRRACSRSSPTSPTSTATPTRTSTRSPRSERGESALLDFDYGFEVVRLTMAAYLSAEQGRAVDLTDPATLERLDDYVPLIQQGRGAEVLSMPAR